MKKFTSLLIGCSLALAGAAMAQQPEEQSSPKPDQAVQKGKGHPAETKPVAPKEVKPTTAPEQHGGKPAPDGTKMEQTQPMPKHQPSVPAQTKGSTEKTAGETTAGATPGVKAEESTKGAKTAPTTAKPAATPVTMATPTPVAKTSATPSGEAECYSSDDCDAGKVLQWRSRRRRRYADDERNTSGGGLAGSIE